MKGAAVFLLALALLLVSSSSTTATAAEITACVTAKGRMTLIGAGYKRQTCRTKETPLTFNTEGPQGPQGESGEQGPEGPEGPAGMDGLNAAELHLYDGNGQDLGVLIGAPQLTSARREITVATEDGNTLSIMTHSSTPFAFQLGEAEGHMYTAPNCTGEAFKEINPFLAVSTVGGRHFASTGDYTGATRLRVSVLNQGGSCDTFNPPYDVIPSFPLEEITLPFSPSARASAHHRPRTLTRGTKPPNQAIRQPPDGFSYLTAHPSLLQSRNIPPSSRTALPGSSLTRPPGGNGSPSSSHGRTRERFFLG